MNRHAIKHDKCFPQSMHLGAYTVICPGNKNVLNAGKDFGSYLWQNGSSDSTFIVTTPDTYHIQ